VLITFCGVRGSTPAPGADYVRYGGNTSCVAIARARGAAPVLALDAGTGLATLTGLLGGAAFAGTILLSHLHWDHSLGLPFFRAGDRDDARVTVLVPEQEAGQGGPGGAGRGEESAAERLLGR
jgi:phosphoribosyl 1,2-cyclic phosphodiesterase